MKVRRPTTSQLAAIADGLGMAMTSEDIDFFAAAIEPCCLAYDALQLMPDDLPVVSYPRTPGYFPGPEENPHNAWYVKTTIPGAASGKLAGKTIALKDNICLAGVPMMNGASALEGYVPEIDATVVTRILDAGGTIVGKVQCEYYCYSGNSHTSAKGPVHNPRKMGYSAGGSSSGSAAVVAAGEVDMSLGCDQAGSIRIPASFCGVYGMKPTHGLVPYTGIIGIDPVIDHVGPMTASVADNALLLEVLAGADSYDPRQYAPIVRSYTEALGRGADGLRIAIVTEGFGHPQSDPAVDATVRQGAALFAELGAVVSEVSIPLHRLGPAIWSPIGFEGAIALMMKANGFPAGTGGLYIPSLAEAHAAWRQHADELPDTVKVGLLVGEYFQTAYRGRYYGKARNLLPRLRAAYDAVLADFDLLLMPTLPVTASPLPGPENERSWALERSFEVLANTCPFDATHHPALSLPCGMADGLPVGLMLVAKHYGEMAIYRAAHAFEQASDWKTL
ncbi:MAG: amidase [Rhodospirillales bacterium]|nr:amidase [Rhodospirillales bacterium]